MLIILGEKLTITMSIVDATLFGTLPHGTQVVHPFFIQSCQGGRHYCQCCMEKVEGYMITFNARDIY